ncbi:prefoldin subunit alpha [Candidatus Woesearchaeota archaeon]|nr:prefoldin subunit alpha [Candidatus Woesearchaeota archaeon]
MADKKKEIDAERKQELYMQLRELDEHIKNMNTHLEKIDEQIAELSSSKVIVSKFTELKKGDELKVPIASGVYITASLEDTKKLLVNVGASVTVEKTPVEVLTLLDSQLDELSTYRETLVGNMKELIKRIEVIQEEFE